MSASKLEKLYDEAVTTFEFVQFSEAAPQPPLEETTVWFRFCEGAMSGEGAVKSWLKLGYDINDILAFGASLAKGLESVSGDD